MTFVLYKIHEKKLAASEYYMQQRTVMQFDTIPKLGPYHRRNKIELILVTFNAGYLLRFRVCDVLWTAVGLPLVPGQSTGLCPLRHVVPLLPGPRPL
jgi:hypothetical protein